MNLDIQPGRVLIPVYEERRKHALENLTFWMEQYLSSPDENAKLGWDSAAQVLNSINTKLLDLYQPETMALVTPTTAIPPSP